MTDTDRIKWLNWYVQGDDTVEFSEEDGGVILWFGNPSGMRSIVGSSVEDCIDQVAQLNPMP